METVKWPEVVVSKEPASEIGQEMFHLVISFVDWFDFEMIYLNYFEILQKPNLPD